VRLAGKVSKLIRLAGSARTLECGAAVSKNLGGIGLADEQADRLLAVLISYSDVHFASHCGRNTDIELSPKSAMSRLMHRMQLPALFAYQMGISE
jgi:hypothetical protein